MSRTYRRKNVKADCERLKYYELDDGIYSICDFWEALYFEYNNWKEYKKDIALFHSDSYMSWPGSRPDKEFRRLYGHKHDRARTREAINKEMRAIERGNVVFP